jgi:hypothetical protein
MMGRVFTLPLLYLKIIINYGEMVMRIQCLDCRIILEIKDKIDIEKNHWYKIDDELYCCPHCDIAIMDNKKVLK